MKNKKLEKITGINILKIGNGDPIAIGWEMGLGYVNKFIVKFYMWNRELEMDWEHCNKYVFNFPSWSRKWGIENKYHYCPIPNFPFPISYFLFPISYSLPLNLPDS